MPHLPLEDLFGGNIPSRVVSSVDRDLYPLENVNKRNSRPFKEISMNERGGSGTQLAKDPKRRFCPQASDLRVGVPRKRGRIYASSQLSEMRSVEYG